MKFIYKGLSVFFALIMAFGGLGSVQVSTAKALNEQSADAAVTQANAATSVSNFNELEKAITEASKTEETVINITENIVFTGVITVKANTNIKLQASSNKTLTQNSDRHFEVENTATLKLENGIILDGENLGGGIHNRGVLNVEAGAKIQNCKANYGGAIDNDVNSTVIVNGEISKNTATNNGGGICSYGSGSTVTISGIVSYNTAGYDGGGIFNDDFSTLTVNKGGMVNSNMADRYGGGIFSYGSRTTVTINGTVSSNMAEYGGGINNFYNGTVNINGEVNNNTANSDGGGIFSNGSNAAVTINGKINGNTSKSSGGGVFSEFGIITINGEISSNSAIEGGGIYSNGNKATVHIKQGGSIITNSATKEGGGIFNHFDGTVTINGKVSENSANSGGGIANFCDGSITIEQGGMVSNNKAIKEGGGILSQGNGTTVTINKGGLVNSNLANSGGGISSEFGAVIINGEITNNTADYDGGGISSWGTSAKVIINQDGVVSANTAREGGGIDHNGTVMINGKVISNSANSGGGIYNNFNGTVTINKDGVVSDNIAKEDGGGIWVVCNQLANITVENGAIFNGNKATNPYWMIDPTDIETHDSHIFTNQHSQAPEGKPSFEYAYNNYDISYTRGLQY